MPDALEKPKPDYSRLTRAEIGSLLALHRAGKSQTEIAETLTCAISTVHHWIHELDDTTELAKAKVRASALDIAESTIRASQKAARKGNADPGLELLDRLGVAEKRQTSSHAAINVVVGLQIAQP